MIQDTEIIVQDSLSFEESDCFSSPIFRPNEMNQQVLWEVGIGQENLAHVKGQSKR